MLKRAKNDLFSAYWVRFYSPSSKAKSYAVLPSSSLMSTFAPCFIRKSAVLISSKGDESQWLDALVELKKNLLVNET